MAIEPFTIVIFGASGDLTRRKVIPALFRLWCEELLPKEVSIVGFARKDMTAEALCEAWHDPAFDELGTCDPVSRECCWEAFTKRVRYLQGHYDDAASFSKLREQVETNAAEAGLAPNCIFYLATPPSVFTPILENLAESGLARKGHPSPWSRVVIEKPFGRDLESARVLNLLAGRLFDEDQIYRIDHYLGKETVQNIFVLRFANGIFEHLWNQKYIDHVQITVAESDGVGHRAGYYDKSGALRDMVQNHLMHLLSLIAMEPPSSLDADAVRDEKVKVLRSLRRIPGDCADNGVIRGQYTAGDVAGRAEGNYLDAEGVAEKSATETFVAFGAMVDNWRWEGVPFYLRTGKCLPRRESEISIHFRPVPKVLFNADPDAPLEQNVLVIRVQPDEGIRLEVLGKVPGGKRIIKPMHLEFDYEHGFGQPSPEAYERLLLDVASGDATLFPRRDEVEAAWEFVQPVIQGCCETCREFVHPYPAGTWGPQAAADLLASSGRQWHLR
ncbi:MAG: glucose-6-phosphate dehydrogenase [Phycisphaerales bacterium]|jgi:glucose-6-phosphate 1-dehydrogenase|nr:glucose-6-phosphate dehydrogenase [Phycisphaerales bacterium]MBT7171250.1 glucose-6-phosphate dehydrogenase [Phycisphaerales bacterium]